MTNIQNDIRYIKDELAQSRDRISRLEANDTDHYDEEPGVDTLRRRYNQASKSIKKLQRRTAAIEGTLTGFKSAGNDVIGQIANNHSSLTKRINDMQL